MFTIVTITVRVLPQFLIAVALKSIHMTIVVGQDQLSKFIQRKRLSVHLCWDQRQQMVLSHRMLVILVF